MLSRLIISMKYSVPLEALYFVVFSFSFVFIFRLSLTANPISLNLISFIFIFGSFLISSSISFLMSMFLIPATR